MPFLKINLKSEISNSRGDVVVLPAVGTKKARLPRRPGRGMRASRPGVAPPPGAGSQAGHENSPTRRRVRAPSRGGSARGKGRDPKAGLKPRRKRAGRSPSRRSRGGRCGEGMRPWVGCPRGTSKTRAVGVPDPPGASRLRKGGACRGPDCQRSFMSARIISRPRTPCRISRK